MKYPTGPVMTCLFVKSSAILNHACNRDLSGIKLLTFYLLKPVLIPGEHAPPSVNLLFYPRKSLSK